MMDIKLVGGAGFIFAAGVVAVKYYGASWRWAVVYMATDMILVGTTLYFMPDMHTIFEIIVCIASSFLGFWVGLNLANEVDHKPTHYISISTVVAARCAGLLALFLCVDFVRKDFNQANW